MADKFDELFPKEVLDRLSFEQKAGLLAVVEEARKGTTKVERSLLSDGYPATDKGNAARFEDYANGRAKYIEEWGCWVIYRDGIWVRDSEGHVALNEFSHMARMLADKAEANEDEFLLKLAIECENTGKAWSGLRQAAGRVGLRESFKKFDANPYLLNVANGTVDLETGEFRSHSPSDLLMLKAPVAYDSAAQAPLWMRCLETWQPNAEVRGYLQKVMGTALLGIPMKYLFVNYGASGNNGKSKFFEAIGNVLGPYAIPVPSALMLSSKFDQSDRFTSDLFGARMIVCSETESGDRLNEALIKRLTGGDPICARRMRENPWYFEPTHTAFMHTNYEPGIRGTDGAIKSRMRKIPWDVEIPEEDRDIWLSHKLKTEASGILNWLIEGCRLFLADGKKLPEPECLAKATAEYLESQDLFQQFLDECVNFLPGAFDSPTTRVETKELLRAYNKWAKEMGTEPWSAFALRRNMETKGFHSEKKSGKMVFKGLQLREDEQFEFEEEEGI